MVKITFIKDIFSGECEEKEINPGKDLNSIISSISEASSPIEVYDQKSGKTSFINIEETQAFKYRVEINGIEVNDFSLIPEDNADIKIALIPEWSFNKIKSSIGKMVDKATSNYKNATIAFAASYVVFGPIAGVVIGAIGYGITALRNYIDSLMPKAGSSESGKELNNLPDASGSSNVSILDKKYPLLLGKHKITPYLAATPYNEVPVTDDDDKGKDTYVHLLYCAGYGPLKLTDFKLGDLFLAHNKNNTVSGTVNVRDTVMHGKLSGYDSEAQDSGDILRRWKNNDISLEILQKGGDDAYSDIFPQSVIQNDINAKPLFICDKEIDSVATYKGVSFASGYRTNTVRFSEANPSSIEIEFSAPNGLYKSRTYTNSKNHTVYQYKALPIYLAVQWRMYKNSNSSSNAESGEGWNTFSSLNGVEPVTLTSEMMTESNSAHSGNTFPSVYSDYTKDWIGHKVFNLKDFSGLKDDGSLSQMRFVAKYDFSVEEMAKIAGLITDSEGKKYSDLNAVEVRVIKVDANYIDETDSGDTYGAYTFADILEWKYMRTWIFDADKLKEEITYNGTTPVLPVTKDSFLSRPYSKENAEKFCYIALKVKADLAGEISGQVSKFNCIAESFAPTYDNSTGKWSIEKVSPVYKYYDEDLKEITEAQYQADILDGKNVKKKHMGNDYRSQLNSILWTNSNYNSTKKRWFLPEAINNKYITNNIASLFVVSGIGQHLGNEAKDYSDFNMSNVARSFMYYEDVTDGSTYSETDDEYVAGGDNLRHMKWSFNGLITEEMKFSDLQANILTTGRAKLSIDDNCRYQIIIDKPRDYAVMLINQQNAVSTSYSRTFEEQISGYRISFQNEQDDYDSGTLYAMMDGEDYKKPTGDLVDTNFKFITDPVQAWSIGRYNLARVIMDKELVDADVGLSGIALQLGDMVNVQDDTVDVGIGNGARIQSLIEDDDLIYGFISDELFEYDGAVDSNNRCELGVRIEQPSKWNASRIVSLRMVGPDGITMQDGTLLLPTVGKTNQFIFERPIIKDTEKLYGGSSSDICMYKPQVENLISFGKINQIVTKYLVWKITPSDNFKYKLGLYKYDDSVYKYGSKMPVVLPDTSNLNQSGSDNFELNVNVTQAQLQTQIASVLTSFGESLESGVTLPVSNVTCVADESGIALTWKHTIPNEGLTDCYIRLSKDGGETWNGSITKDEAGKIVAIAGYITSEGSFKYYFDRSVDGYPEATELNSWKFSIVAKNTKAGFSTSVECDVDTSSYGTWIVQAPDINQSVTDRTVTLTFNQPKRSDEKTVYGNIKYRVQIKRITPPADEMYYKPATNLNPYQEEDAAGNVTKGNEDNYKDGTGYVTSKGVYVQTLPLMGQSNKSIRDTDYSFQVYAENEKGVSASGSTELVIARCSSLRDIVKARQDAKEFYVADLSAINANLGSISQGSLTGSDDNYWALTNVENGNAIKRYKGEFRVGNKEKYLEVKAKAIDPQTNEPTDYDVILSTDNFRVLTENTTFNKEIIINSNENPYDQVVVKPDQVIIQHRNSESSPWTDIIKLDAAGTLSPTLKANNQIQIGNFEQTQLRKLAHDIGRAYLSSKGLVWHFDDDFYSQNGIEDGLEIIGTKNVDYMLKSGYDRVEGIDYTPAILTKAPYCSDAKCIFGTFSINITKENLTEFTVDWWMQYLFAESQTLFEIGTPDDKLSLQIVPSEPLAVVSGPSTWRHSSYGYIYAATRNPQVGDYLYTTYSGAENNAGSDVTIVSTVLLEEDCTVAEITASDGKTYEFYTGEPDANAESYVPVEKWISVIYNNDKKVTETHVANRANNKKTVLVHKGQVSTESVDILDEMDMEFNEGEWYHFGVTFSQGYARFLMNNKELLNEYYLPYFTRFARAAADVSIQLNCDKSKRVIIDELYIDEVEEDSSDFFKQTNNRLPWAALSDTEDYFIFDAKDVSKVKSNILENVVKDRLQTDIGIKNTDLNTVTTQGFYKGVWGHGCTNTPNSNTNLEFCLEVIYISGTDSHAVLQRFTDRSGTVYVRTREYKEESYTWNDWQTLAVTSDFESYAKKEDLSVYATKDETMTVKTVSASGASDWSGSVKRTGRNIIINGTYGKVSHSSGVSVITGLPKPFVNTKITAYSTVNSSNVYGEVKTDGKLYLYDSNDSSSAGKRTYTLYGTYLTSE